MNNLQNLLTLSHVPRWTIIDTTKPQTVGEHTFRVVAICLYIINELRNINVTVDREYVLTKAITHDIEEAKSGDIPTPYKKNLQQFGFDEHEVIVGLEGHIIKIADIVEAIIFLKRYGTRTSRIQGELQISLAYFKHAAWETMEDPEVVQQSWWNRIIDKILETGAEYE